MFTRSCQGFGQPGLMWFLRTKRRGTCAPGLRHMENPLPTWAAKRKHALALKLQEKDALLHGVEGAFTGEEGNLPPRPCSQPLDCALGTPGGALCAGEQVSMSQVRLREERGFCLWPLALTPGNPSSGPECPLPRLLFPLDTRWDPSAMHWLGPAALRSASCQGVPGALGKGPFPGAGFIL